MTSDAAWVGARFLVVSFVPFPFEDELAFGLAKNELSVDCEDVGGLVLRGEVDELDLCALDDAVVSLAMDPGATGE